ncbi:MAG: Gfo/Idh/MocA family protein [Terriglobales bacterium]
MMNRREFFGKTAGALAAVSALGSGKKLFAAPPSDQINLGIIGPGSRGQALMRAFLRVPGVRFGGLCDVYEPRFAQARKITGEETPIYKDYRKLLEAKDLDAIVVATPLSFHEEHVIGSLESGRHVYGEKDMAKTVDACSHVYRAVKRSGKHYQLGTQYHYAPWFVEALQRIRAGKLGDITQIYGYWHRNDNWRRPVPDPNDKALERLINWRMYREYSGGLLAELGTHQIVFTLEVFGSLPESVIGSGGIDYWKDGREVPDNVQVVYRFPGGKTLFFSSITTNRFEGMKVCVYGTGGTIVLTEAGGTAYYELPSRNSAVPEKLIVEHGIVTTASFRAELPYGGPGETLRVPEDKNGSPDFLACQSFIDCLRNDRRPGANELSGWNSGVSVALGNQAIDSGERIVLAEHAKLPA